MFKRMALAKWQKYHGHHLIIMIITRPSSREEALNSIHLAYHTRVKDGKNWKKNRITFLTATIIMIFNRWSRIQCLIKPIPKIYLFVDAM